MLASVIGTEDIRLTHEAIRPHIRRTPVIGVDLADIGGSGTAWLKLEQLQCSGSFKARGAFTNLLLRDVPPAGVVAASGGNHGVAVAYAANRRGVPAKVFVPTVSAPAKIERIRALGADLVVTGERYADALAEAQRWAETSGAMSVHAYDQRETILGQGTVALELSGQVDGLDTVLVPVGGGGLISGIASWFAGAVRVVGVEPEGAPTLTYARARGEPADGAAARGGAPAAGGRRAGVPDHPGLRGEGGARGRRRDPRGPAGLVEGAADRRRARRVGGDRRAARRRVQARGRRARRGGDQRRQHVTLPT
jgi:threonine dehydratase